MTLSSPKTEKQASNNLPDYADLRCSEPRAVSGRFDRIGITPRSA